jgi:signal transduction histidine kinase
MRRILGWIAGVGVGLSIFLGCVVEGWGGMAWYRLFQRYISWKTQRTLQEAGQLLNQYAKSPSRWLETDEYLLLAYDRRGQLRFWNTSRWPLPATPLSGESPEVIADEDKAYYILKQRVDTLLAVAAIPLWLSERAFASHGYFLGGRWLNHAYLKAAPQPRGNSLPLLYQDLSGRTFFRLYVGPPEAWRYPLQVALLIVGVVTLIALLLWSHLSWRRSLSPMGYTGRMGILLLTIWIALKVSNLPTRYLSVPLFQAESLAWGGPITSAADLIYLMGIGLWFLYRLSPWERGPLPLRLLLYWVLWGITGFLFWALAHHSQLSLEPSDFERAGVTLLLSALVLGMLWRAIELLALGRFSHSFLILALGAVGGLVLGLIGLSWWAAVAIGLLLVLQPLFQKWPAFVSWTSCSLLLAVGINGFFSLAQAWRAQHQAPAYARLAAFPREPLLEARLTYRLAALSQDSLLWRNLRTADNLIDAPFIAAIIRKYFIDIGETYEVALSFWDERDSRLDNQYELLPLAWHRLTPETLQPTLSPFLFFVTKGSKRFFYVSRYPIEYDGYRLFLQVELYPRVRPLSTFFWEAVLRPSYALYDQRQRVRTAIHASFPFYWYRPLQGTWSWQKLSQRYQLFYQASSHQVVVLEYPRRTSTEELATLPILLVLIGILRLGELFSRGASLYSTFHLARTRMAPRIRLLFVASVILPLIGLVLVSFFLFISLAQSNLEDSLTRKLNTLHSYLREEPILIEKLVHGLESYIPQEESYVRDLMQRLARLTESQVAIYTAQGFLYSSTLPPAYTGLYITPLLDPTIKNNPDDETPILMSNSGAGRATYGYAPLRTSTGRLAGFIQVSFPAPTKPLYQSIQGFMAYGINVYLLLVLVSTIIGLLLIERLLRGLSIVEAQIRNAPKGPIPPRLTWAETQDELGTFISAYNDMVSRLEASQKELETTLRQISQQEMARQAAHEIKNALTPIKLIAQHLQRLSHVEPEKLHRLSYEMLQKIDTLARIANRFLTFAGPHGEKGVSLVPLHLNHFLEEYFQPYLRTPQVEMHLILPETPIWIQGHPDLLNLILNNLIQNALQALEGCPDGQIILSLEARGQEAWLSVRDNGPGIHPEIQERMFEFYFTTKRSGTGLGLAISKRLVEQLQGRIFAETQLGRGSVFYVVFPAHMP